MVQDARDHVQRRVDAATAEAMARLALPRRLGSWTELVERIEGVYGKRIRFQAMDVDEWVGITGMWIDYATSGLVLYRRGDSALYQQHSVFHEFGHIVARHGGCGLFDSNAFRADPTHDVAEAVRAVRMRSTSRAGDVEELVAEEIAFALTRRLLAPGGGTGRITAEEVFG